MPRAAPVTTATGLIEPRRPVCRRPARGEVVRPGSSGAPRPPSALAPVGSPSTPLGDTGRTPSARRPGHERPSGSVQPASATLIRTTAGSRASMSDVSVRPACASPPAGAAVPHDDVVALGRRGAPPRAERVGVAPVRRDHDHAGERVARAERTSSTTRSARTSWSDRAACRRSRRARRSRRRRGPAPPRRRAVRGRAARASAAATRVSVSSGRCGPCCSSDPSGTARTRGRPVAATSGQVARAELHGAVGADRTSGTQRPAWAPAAAPRHGHLGVTERRAAGVPTRAASAASPWPCTHSGSGPSSGRPGEELGRHAPAPAGVAGPARRARARALGLAERREERRVAPHRGETRPASRTLPARNSLVDHERAGVDVADGVDQAHHAARAAQVEPVEGLAEGGEVEEGVAGQHVGVLEQPVVQRRAAARRSGAARPSVSTPRPEGRSRVSRSWAP